MSADSRPLGELWIEAGWMTRAQLDKLLAVQREVVARQGAQATAPRIQPKAASAVVDLEVTATGQISTREGRRIDRILEYAVAQRASDVHIMSGERVLLRREGELAFAGGGRVAVHEILLKTQAPPRPTSRISISSTFRLRSPPIAPGSSSPAVAACRSSRPTTPISSTTSSTTCRCFPRASAAGPLVAADWSADWMAERLENLYFQILGRRAGAAKA